MSSMDSIKPAMYLHDKEGNLRGIPNFGRMCLYPIPMTDLDYVIYPKPKKDGSIGHWFYKGKKPLMTEIQMKKAKK